MPLDTIIDKLTPCLIDTSTGKVSPTIFSVATTEDIIGLADKGWLSIGVQIHLKN